METPQGMLPVIAVVLVPIAGAWEGFSGVECPQIFLVFSQGGLWVIIWGIHSQSRRFPNSYCWLLPRMASPFQWNHQKCQQIFQRTGLKNTSCMLILQQRALLYEARNCGMIVSSSIPMPRCIVGVGRKCLQYILFEYSHFKWSVSCRTSPFLTWIWLTVLC